jgi:DNA invertase Pin-like site-specific DNA recombinase
VADTERTLIKKRQAEGIAAAKARGVKFGRLQRFYYTDYHDIFNKVLNNEITNKEAIKIIGCCETTFYRILRKWREANGLCKHQWKKSG